MSTLCPDPECTEDECPADECCTGIGCHCAQSQECATEPADYLGDGTTLMHCRDHKTEYTRRPPGVGS